MTDSGTSVGLLRHTVATLAYRASKVLRDAPASFATFRITETSRTPGAIVAHMGDLFDWALALAEGEHRWHDTEPGDWTSDVVRFFSALDAFDAYLASGAPLGWTAEQLFQGPVADALTHTGQLAMLRRAAGHPVRGENYAKADIRMGHTGMAQAASRVEFD